MGYPVGPVSTSPRALHGWALESSSYSFRSCWAGISVVRVLSWVKPCSASWDLLLVCAFLKKKYIHLSVAPEPLAIWNKKLVGLVLKLFWFLIQVFLSKRTRILLGPGSFWHESLKLFVLKKSSWWRALFSRKKVHSLSVAPEPLAIWNKELESLESYVVQKS